MSGPPDPSSLVTAFGAAGPAEVELAQDAPTVPAADADKCPHETCRVSTLYQRYMDKTQAKVKTWAVDASKASKTDRTAVTIFQPARDVALFEYAIRTNMHRLGPQWALQIFYGSEEDKELLDAALDRPAHVTWTPIAINGTRLPRINKNAANFFRLSPFFWDEIPEQHEHVLIFESDGLVLKGDGCVEGYFDYDYVGAPWDTSIYWGRRHPPAVGGNGGFTLRRRSSNVAAIKSEYNELNMKWLCWLHLHRNKWKWGPSRFTQNEDGEMVGMLQKMNAKFPSRELAMKFAVERLYQPDACAFHNPWEFLDHDQAEQLLLSAGRT